MTILSSLNDPALLAMLTGGAVGVAPTDTIYGLVCSARDVTAVEKLYRLKGREHKPGTVIAANVDQLVELGVNASMLHSVEQLWPASLSVVIPASEDAAYLDQGVGSLAVRIPHDETVRALLVKAGPLLTTSANLPGMEPAANVAEAQGYFDGKVNFYVDGGEVRGRPPSTVARLHPNGKLELLRPGAVKIAQEWLIA